MKEKPILFRGEMVNAVLKNRKTQHRFLIKDQCEHCEIDACGRIDRHCDHGTGYLKNPYEGVERLWVKETWRPYSWDWQEGWMDLIYVSDGTYSNPIAVPDNSWLRNFALIHKVEYDPKNKPSIFMPRWASRINLTVKNIRVEKLQDITEEDCIAEGIERGNFTKDYRKQYRNLWQSINGLGSWNFNPYVRVVEFEMEKA